MGLLRAQHLTRSTGLHDAHDPGPKTGKTARRKLANKLVGILHGTLTHRTGYQETIAWQHWQTTKPNAA